MIEKLQSIEQYEKKLEELFKQEEKKLFAVAFSILKNKEDAKDACQEAFEQLWQKRQNESYKEIKSLASYIYIVVKNTAIALLKKRPKKEHEEIEGSEVLALEDVSNKLDSRRQTSGILDKIKSSKILTEKEFDIIMHWADGVTYKDIVPLINTKYESIDNREETVGTIRGKLQRSKKKLKVYFNEHTKMSKLK